MIHDFPECRSFKHGAWGASRLSGEASHIKRKGINQDMYWMTVVFCGRVFVTQHPNVSDRYLQGYTKKMNKIITTSTGSWCRETDDGTIKKQTQMLQE